MKKNYHLPNGYEINPKTIFETLLRRDF